MILIHYTPNGMRRTVDIQDIFHGGTAMLVGGSPSLLEQPVDMLNDRGVLSMAMNNAAMHFQPTLWVSGDRPECYAPKILLDPTIMKFGIISHADVQLDKRYDNRKYHQMPNQYFYIPEDNVPWDEYFANRRGVPWYNNSLFVGIHILYRLGIRKIILAGSDFGFSKTGAVYAHKTGLNDLEKKWNSDLYGSQAYELRRLKPLFDKFGLELYDSSLNSRISQVYTKLTFEEAIAMCKNAYPAVEVDSKDLPHCSKFAPESLKGKVALWPGYTPVVSDAKQPKKQDTANKKRGKQGVL